MHLKKPCQICNQRQTGLVNGISQFAPVHHNARLRNKSDCYELWLHIADIDISDILVYLKYDTIEVFQKNASPQCPDTLLLLLPVPQNIKADEIKVRRVNDGILIVMPK